MSYDINVVFLIGNLVRDPELRHTGTGMAVCSFSIANNTSGKGSGDQNTSYFDIVAFNKTAELANQYLAKGRKVAITGRLQQRRWEDQNGQKRYKVEVIVTNLNFFGPQSGGSSAGDSDLDYYDHMQGSASGQKSEPAPHTRSTPAKPAPPVDDDAPPEYSHTGDMDDDEIPF